MGNTVQKPKSPDRPPPRPPKPRHLSGPRYDSTSSQASDDSHIALTTDSQAPDLLLTLADRPDGIYSTVVKSDLASESMTLAELVEMYGAHLPLIFSVSESLYGICEDNSLLEQQLLSIHFQKKTKIIDVEASFGAKYMIPINSSFECSPLYNPHGKLELAKQGYSFETVGDLMKAKPLPLMVHVDYTDHTDVLPEGRIAEGDILILIRVVFDSERRKKLDCIDYKTKSPKLLSEGCCGQFSTRVSDLRFSLSEIEPHFTLPTSAIFYSPTDGSFKLPLYATVGCYTITNCRSIRSVIASTFYKKDDGTAIVDLMEILLDVPIEVQLVKLSEDQLQQLQQQTKPLFDTFHPSCLSKVITDQASSTNYIQTQLFKVIPKDDRWKAGVTLQPPHHPATTLPIDDDDYEMMDQFVTTPVTSLTSASLPQFSVLSPGSLPLATSHSLDIINREKCPSPSLPQNKSSLSSGSQSADDPVPYLIAKFKPSEGRIEHSVPYDYVKFTDGQAQLDKVMKEKLEEMGKQNRQLQEELKTYQSPLQESK